MDLIVANVQLMDAAPGKLTDIGVEDGRIVAIGPGLVADAQRFDAGGRLACPGLVETHIHLDKARLLERCPAERGRVIRPVPYVAPFKPAITEEDVRERAEATLRECLVHGTTRIRTHVEVDPGIGLRGFNAVASLMEDYAWAVDLQLCVFPQEGLTNYPGTEDLLVQALKRGAKVIGGAPRYDTDHPGQIRRIFELAREFDVDIDLHLDVGNTPEDLDALLVCDLTEQYRLGGRVTVGHMTKLSLMPPSDMAVVARRLADAGVAVSVLPATDLYLMGRDRDHSVCRGVADAHALLAHGVNCSISSNNVLNPATPFGDCSLVRMANLYANVVQTAQPEELRECFAMLTNRSARILNATDYGIALGNPADIVVFDSPSPERTIAEIRNPIAVFKNGKRTVTWHAPELHH
ncbi:MAG TPA: amidohydrolase [Acetobacteraceae bacterium]|jgi:cytosine/creatinine deaminase|nr:amidohydrolase [Acetobacteraceae bacterium]